MWLVVVLVLCFFLIRGVAQLVMAFIAFAEMVGRHNTEIDNLQTRLAAIEIDYLQMRLAAMEEQRERALTNNNTVV